MIWLALAAIVLCVGQQVVHARERRRLTDLVVARHAPDAALLAKRPHRPRRKPEEVHPPKLSEGVD